MFILASLLMRLINYTCFLFLLMAFVNSNAQQLRFDRFDLSNGLSQNNINCMEFDQLGNVWIGTLDGVNRYNGYQFDIFKPNRSIKNHLVGNHVISLGAGLNGDMWMVTRGGGLNHFDAVKQRFQLINPEIFGQFNLEQSNSIVQTADSLIWLNNGSIVGVWNPVKNAFQTTQIESSIRGIRKWASNSVLIFGNFGIKKINFDRNKNDFQISLIDDQSCYGLVVNEKGVLEVNADGIYSLNIADTVRSQVISFTYTPFSTISKTAINDFAVTGNTYWLGGNGFFVRFYPSENDFKFQRFENDPLNDYSFKGYNVTRLRVDELGNLWIGTAKNGLLHLNNQKNQFQHYSWKIESTTDPESNPVRAICKTQNNNLWLGFDTEGIALLEPNSALKYYRYYFTNSNEKRIIQNVRTIFEDSRGNVWIGVNDNLCIYNKSQNRFESVNCRFNWSWPYRCYVVKEFEPGVVTISSPTILGLINLSDGSLTTIPVKLKGTSSLQNVRDIVQDKYRNLWLAQDNVGLLKITYPNLNYEFFQSSADGLSDNKVYCLLATGDSLWIGTNGGLNLLNLKTNKIEQKYFEEDGLSNNIVYSISKDVDGKLWMSTNRGITCFETKTSSFKTYLSNDYFMDDAHFAAKNGTLFYGGYTGVVSFQPQNLKPLSDNIHSRFESLSVFNQAIYPGDTIDGEVILKKELSETTQISFNYRQNTFTIGFNAYPFDYPNIHQFRYRLKNYQNEWMNDNGSRMATYTKLPPGNYTFQLEVAPFHNQFGHLIELNVKIVPPFWMTTWFKMVVVAFLILLVGGLFRLRIKQVQQRNIWLQKKVDEQTKELREQNRKIVEMSDQLHEADQSKLRFFTNISHEFRTPLTLILGHLDHLSSDSKLAVKSIRRNATRLLKLINQLIDLRKMDQDQLGLLVSKFELISFVNELVDGFSSMAEQKQLGLNFKSNSSELWVWLDIDKTEKILYNLLSNAIKYSPEGKSILVVVEESADRFCVEVQDQGIGISEQELDAIFERFYRTSNSQSMAGGHGIGLSMVKGLTTIQHGEIKVESNQGEGSRFRVTFLKGKEHFAASDFGENVNEKLLVEDEHDLLPAGIEKLGGQKILVVEDHAELAQFIVQILNEQFEVRTAENGKVALDLLTEFVPDLIISDVMMPVMDGIHFCRTVKNSIETSHIPLILLSAKTDIETQISGLETGADDYVEKPFQPKLLLAKINSLLLNRQKLRALFKQAPGDVNVANQLNGRDKEFLQKVNELIKSHLSDSQFSIEVLSEKVNMSRATFYRKFSDLTGIKPADYIRRYRLKTAYDLFLTTGKTTQEVSELVGFQSISHFRKSFKDEFGVTPGSILKG